MRISIRQKFGCAVVMVAVLGLATCADRPEHAEATAEPEAARAQIHWPEVPLVLDGTDLIPIEQTAPAPFSLTEVAGEYATEQGGAALTLTVRLQDGSLEIERRFMEPGREILVKRYVLQKSNPQGAASSLEDIFLIQTQNGVLLLEKDSGVESIAATYWICYAPIG